MNPDLLVGAVFLGVFFVFAASIVSLLIRRATRRAEVHLTDVTALRFVSASTQVLVYLIGFVLYAHLVPELRALGTALLTGVSVVSVVVGLAAQNTLGYLDDGLSLVLYRPIHVSDRIQIGAPTGVITARVESVSLGFTMLRDDNVNAMVVPNSVMMSSALIWLAQR